MDLEALREALVEQVWFSSEDVSFDHERGEVRIPFGEATGSYFSRSPRHITPMGTVVIRGVDSAEARDQARITLYDILDIDVEPGSMRIASNFPYEIRMRTGASFDCGIEWIDPSTRSASDGVGPSG